MAAHIIDGRAIAQDIVEQLRIEVASLTQPPVLAIILFGENEASLAYIRQKLRAAKQVGITALFFHFPEQTPQPEVMQAVQEIQQGAYDHWNMYLQNTDDVSLPPVAPHALIVQRPMPNHINVDDIFTIVDPQKDVDGFHVQSPFTPPVAEAILEIISRTLEQSDMSLVARIGQRKIVLVGYGETAGKPIANVLTATGISYEIVRSKTPNPQTITRQADILISAIGKPHVITGDWVKRDAIVIDVGTSRIETGEIDVTGRTKTQLAGDCDSTVGDKVKLLTPVPGGVGPVNVACLMKNVVLAAQQ